MTDDEGGPEPRRDARPRRAYRSRLLLLAIVVAGAWVAALGLPGLGRLAGLAAGAVGATLGILVGAMALGWLGFGLFAMGERVVAYLRRGPRWSDPADPSWMTDEPGR